MQRKKSRKNLGYGLAFSAPTLLLLIVAFVIPMIMFFRYSFFSYERGVITEEYTLSTYARFVTDPFYWQIAWQSLKLSLLVTGFALLIGYPLAYALCKIRSARLRSWLLVIIFSPLVVSVVVRTYGWLVLLGDQGVINYLLIKLGIRSEPLKLAYNFTGVVVSLVHIFLPYMVFSIYSVLLRLSPALKEASSDLGASWWKTFLRVTLPLSVPGIISGVQLCFTLTLGAFTTPSLLGGGKVTVLPLTIYRNVLSMNWPFGSVAGVILLVMALLAVLCFNKAMDLCKLD